MATVVSSMAVSVDGYYLGPDGGFDWARPGPDVFRHVVKEFREVDAHVLGRRVFETMTYWDTVADDLLDDDEREWGRLWRAMPKVVLSSTLTSVPEGYRLATERLAEELAALKAAPGLSTIAIGGPTLAAAAAALDLVDEYRVRIHPVVVGGGRPFYPQGGPQVDLELVDSRAFPSGVVWLRHRVRRDAPPGA